MAYRIILVGVGPQSIGAAWLRAIGQSAEWTLVGVVDANPAYCSQAAQAAGLPAERCFGTVGQAVAAVESDAVAIAVPSPLHAALCAEALGRAAMWWWRNRSPSSSPMRRRYACWPRGAACG